MKTLTNIFGTLVGLLFVVAVAIWMFFFGIRTQQTADEEALNPSNYEVTISSEGIEVESKLTETDIMKKTIFNIADDIDALINGEFDETTF